MSDGGWFDVLKYCLGVTLTAIIGVLASAGKKMVNRITKVEEKIYELEKFQAVHRTQLNQIEASLNKLDEKLDNIIERLPNKR